MKPQRALLATPTAASAFCTTYTAAITPIAIPTAYAAGCQSLPSRVSSACACVNTAAPTPGAYARITPPSGALIVDGSKPYSPGVFPKLQAAILALSFTTTTNQSIFIYPGTYNEQVYIPVLKSSLVIQGWTTDARSYKENGATITFGLAAGSLNVSNNDLSGTIRSWNPNTKIYNLNIKNSFGVGKQAIALSAQADKQGYYGCQLLGYQDTVLTNRGNHLFAKTLITGAVDFIFGQYSTAWFEQVDIRVTGTGWVTANGRLDDANPSWYVINNSTVAGIDSSIADGSSALGRPWRAWSRTVFQNTFLTKVIQPLGYTVWNAPPADPQTQHVFYAEYNNTGPGSVGAGAGPRSNFTQQLDAPIAPETVLGPTWQSEWYVDASYL